MKQEHLQPGARVMVGTMRVLAGQIPDNGVGHRVAQQLAALAGGALRVDEGGRTLSAGPRASSRRVAEVNTDTDGDDEPEERTCDSCGEENDAAAKFCDACGAELSDDDGDDEPAKKPAKVAAELDAAAAQAVIDRAVLNYVDHVNGKPLKPADLSTYVLSMQRRGEADRAAQAKAWETRATLRGGK